MAGKASLRQTRLMQCSCCGVLYTAKTSAAHYHSSACRQRAYRIRKRARESVGQDQRSLVSRPGSRPGAGRAGSGK
jgi:hypothetical protein